MTNTTHRLRWTRPRYSSALVILVSALMGSAASSSRISRITFPRPLRGGTYLTTSSAKNIKPTLSLFLRDANMRTAATSTAVSILLRLCEPKAPDAEMSTAIKTVSSRSSQNVLTYGTSDRAVTFQSMLRISSPGTYSRTASNSMPRPLNALRYSPANKSLTCRLATIWMRRTSFRTSSSSRAAMLIYGTGTDSRTFRTISSEVICSASASYDKMIRCRSTSNAMSLTSCGVT